MGYKYEPNKIIKMYGGDSHSIFVTLDNELGENDKLVFVLMEPYASFDEPLFASSEFNTSNTETSYVLHLKPEDTENLIPGLYYYSVKAFYYHDETTETKLTGVETIIPKTKFIILE